MVAELRRHSADLSLYAAFLLNVLSAALPPELVGVRREGKLKARLASRDPAVLGVSVLLDDHRFELSRDDVAKPATARVRHESGGVVLSTRTIGVDEWTRALAAALGRLAQHNAAAAAARTSGHCCRPATPGWAW